MFALALQSRLELDRGYAPFTSATNSSCAASCVWPGASLNVSANQAIISASIASFLASRPADSAKLRTRLGSTIRHLDAGALQHLAPVALVTATCLHHRLANLALAKPGNQPPVTLCGAGARLPQRRRANARIHLVLGHIDTHDNPVILCHHPLPSLRSTGSKPLQPFGLRKTPELSLALLQTCRLRAQTGSVPATGGFARTARSHILTDFQDTRAQGRPGAHGTRGLVCKIVRKNAHEHTGSAETLRHSLRNGFTAYAVLSPATRLCCRRRLADGGASQPGWADAPPQNLTPALGPQDHTVLPYATRLRHEASSGWYPSGEILAKTETAPFVLRAGCSLTETALRTNPCADAVASTTSHPAFVTTATRPSWG
jgi:hypothetical protein